MEWKLKATMNVEYFVKHCWYPSFIMFFRLLVQLAYLKALFTICIWYPCRLECLYQNLKLSLSLQDTKSQEMVLSSTKNSMKSKDVSQFEMFGLEDPQSAQIGKKRCRNFKSLVCYFISNYFLTVLCNSSLQTLKLNVL